MKKSYSSDAQRLFSTRWISALMLSMLFLSTGSASIAQRVTNGLVTLYNFQESNGSTVHDVSGQTPIDLSIQNPGNVSWLSGGGLRVNSSTIIKSNGAATRLNNSMSSSSEMTFECWVRPNTINQSGPARIMTCSSNNSNHNFSVGQNGNTFNSCLRTSSTSNSGQEFNQGSAVVNLLHYCFTWKNGVEKIYCNGQLIHTGTCSGSPNNWNSSYGFALCNEFSMDRPWLGDFYLVACYNQELDQNEVNQNFNCGPGNSHGNPTCIETCSFDGYNGTGGSVCNIPNFGSDFRCGEIGRAHV